MGTDNLFHKKRLRKNRSLERAKAKRESYDKILIVCEGEKTEPLYFTEIQSIYRLSSSNVKVVGDCDSAPISVVRYAIELAKKEKEINVEYDYVYCVFDKDNHTSYKEAMELAKNCEINDSLVVINSVPSFEFWILLHYKKTTKGYSSNRKNSCGKQVLHDLKKHFPTYEKGMSGVFSHLHSNGLVDVAIKNAKDVNERALQNETDMPSTKVYMLVEKMITLK